MPEVAFFNQKLGIFEKKLVMELADKQKLVGGLIEPVQITEHLDFVFNEEGLIKNMEPSVVNKKGSVKYVGPFFITRLGTNGGYINLKVADWKFIKSIETKPIITENGVSFVAVLDDEYLPVW